MAGLVAQNEYRAVGQFGILAQSRKHLLSVHARHQDVKQDDVGPGNLIIAQEL
jgi:hypothetical protein